MDVNLEFVHSEALAEKFVEKVSEIKHLMVSGENDKCMEELVRLQEEMIVALAISESCCTEELH